MDDYTFNNLVSLIFNQAKYARQQVSSELKLLEAAKGKESSDYKDASIELLVVKNMRLARYIIKKFDANGEAPRELLSEAFVGLVKAAINFDPSRGVKLSTYAARLMIIQILIYLKKNTYVQDKKRLRKLESYLYDTVTISKEGEPLPLIDTLAVEDYMEEDIIDRILAREIKNFINLFSGRDKEVLRLRYLENKTQLETCEILGCSRSNISKIEKRVSNRLRIIGDLPPKTHNIKNKDMPGVKQCKTKDDDNINEGSRRNEILHIDIKLSAEEETRLNELKEKYPPLFGRAEKRNERDIISKALSWGIDYEDVSASLRLANQRTR